MVVEILIKLWSCKRAASRRSNIAAVFLFSLASKWQLSFLLFYQDTLFDVYSAWFYDTNGGNVDDMMLAGLVCAGETPSVIYNLY